MRFLQAFFVIAFSLALIPVKARAGWPLNTDSMPKNWGSGCPDSVTVEIGGMKLSVPRHDAVLKLNGDQVKYADLQNCSTRFVGNVRSVEWPHESLTDAKSFPGDAPTTYKRYEREIDEAWRKGEFDENLTALKRIERPASELYILFPENDEPVVFDCDGHQKDVNKMSFLFCHVSCVYPAGIVFSYSFDRRDHPDSEYLKIDREKRAEIERMIKAADTK